MGEFQPAYPPAGWLGGRLPVYGTCSSHPWSRGIRSRRMHGPAHRWPPSPWSGRRPLRNDSL